MEGSSIPQEQFNVLITGTLLIAGGFQVQDFHETREILHSYFRLNEQTKSL